MAAIVVSVASTLVASSPRYSSSSTSLLFTKLRSSSPFLRFSLAVTPFCSRKGRLMAHTLAQANLGLTYPAGIEAPKVSLSLSLWKPIISFSFCLIFWLLDWVSWLKFVPLWTSVIMVDGFLCLSPLDFSLSVLQVFNNFDGFYGECS